MLDPNAFSESPELQECLSRLHKSEEGCYTVSTLAELAFVVKKMQEEKVRQTKAAESKKKEGGA